MARESSADYLDKGHLPDTTDSSSSTEGHVRCFFSQGPQKFIRRNKRFVKAKRVFPKLE